MVSASPREGGDAPNPSPFPPRPSSASCRARSASRRPRGSGRALIGRWSGRPLAPSGSDPARHSTALPPRHPRGAWCSSPLLGERRAHLVAQLAPWLRQPKPPAERAPSRRRRFPVRPCPGGQGALPLVQGPGDDRWRSPRPPPRVGRWAAGRTGIGPRAPGGLARRPVPAREGRSRGGSPAPGRWRGPRGLSRPTGRSGRERSGTGERLDGLVCLAVAQVLLGCHSERRWLRFAQHRLGHLFTLPAPATR